MENPTPAHEVGVEARVIDGVVEAIEHPPGVVALVGSEPGHRHGDRPQGRHRRPGMRDQGVVTHVDEVLAFPAASSASTWNQYVSHRDTVNRISCWVFRPPVASNRP